MLGAKFKQSRTVVPLQSATLENGMTELQLVYQGWDPEGTQIVIEIKPEGADEWVPLDARAPNPLANLPVLVQMRAVFIGTTDVQPSLRLDTYAQVLTRRHALAMKAVSNVLEFGFATDDATIVMYVDAVDTEAVHTFTPKLIVAGAPVTAASVITEADPDRATRRKITAAFGLAAATSARLLLESTTDTPVSVPFIQDVQLNAF